MEVLVYPDPILRRGGKPIATFDAALRETAQAMLAAMYDQRGVGLAAPQVGLELDLLVLNPSGDRGQPDEELTLINPELRKRTKDREWGEEGCLSFPGIYGEVERHVDIVVAYRDLDGAERTLEASDFLARVIQHEMDHLDGVLMVDRFSPVDRIRVKPKLLELERAFRKARA
jgi:peptide deformylase